VASWLHAPVFFRVYRSDLVDLPASPLSRSSSLGIRYPSRVLFAFTYPGYGFPNPASPLGLPPALRFSAKTLPRAFRTPSNLPLVGFRVPAEFSADQPGRFVYPEGIAPTTLMNFRTLQHLPVTGIRF
jgi:hypothetical protein